MGLWTSLFRRETADHALAEVRWDLQLQEYMQSGTSRELSSAIAAVYRARNMTVDTVASIPVMAGESRVPAPNPEQTMHQFLVETMRSLMDCGDAYWHRTERGNWYVLNPSMMKVSWTDDTQRTRMYVYRTQRMFVGINLRVLSLDRGPEDLHGYGPMESARVKGMLAEQAYIEQFFKNNASPVGVLSVPRTMTEDESVRLKEQWTKAQSDRRPAVLTGGMEWTATGFNANDSQWVEAHRTSVGDAALLFGIPGPILGYNTPGASLTYTNIADLHEQWWRETLYPSFARRIEDQMTDLSGTVVRFDPEEFFLASLHNRSLSARQLVDAGYNRDDVLDATGFKPMRSEDILPTTLQQEPSESAQEPF